MLTLAGETGCWCPKVMDENNPLEQHGNPVNPYDTACRQLQICRRQASTCGACSTTSHADIRILDYHYAFNPSPSTFSCVSDDSCALALCKCEATWAKEFLRIIDESGRQMVVDDGDTNLNAGDCSPGGGGGGGNAVSSNC